MSKRNNSPANSQICKPKKPLSGYIRFTCQNREAFKKKYPDLNNKEIIKLLAKEWNKFSEGEKKKFNDAFEKDKKKYEEEVRSYEDKTHPRQEYDDKRYENKTRHNTPKKPICNYLRFISENREDFKKKNLYSSNNDIIRLLAKEWSKLSDTKKKKFNDAYEKEKKEYEEELRSYGNKDQLDPPKEPLSGYIRFTCENQEAFQKNNPYLNNKEIIKLLAKEWNNLSEDRKNKFKNFIALKNNN